MSQRFYTSSPLAVGPFALEGAEAHHLAAVCRASPGDAVSLFNGDGKEYRARVVAVRKRWVDLDIDRVSEPERELPLRLEVAAPLPKGDREQVLIEKLTEFGVTAFVPLECRRSVVHVRDKKLERLERHVVEASKQCGRNVLMRIEPPMPWTSYCLPRPGAETRWLAHPCRTNALPPTPHRPAGTQALRVAIGPEGGFTDEEAALGVQHGWQLLDLGPRILRIESAAMAAVILAGHAGAPWA